MTTLDTSFSQSHNKVKRMKDIKRDARMLLLSRFSRVRLCATPSTAAHQAPPSLGFCRQEHWSRLPFPSPMHESEKWKWSLPVVSNSSRLHGLQPTRLLCPWGFSGKSTGVGCHCLLQCKDNSWVFFLLLLNWFLLLLKFLLYCNYILFSTLLEKWTRVAPSVRVPGKTFVDSTGKEPVVGIPETVSSVRSHWNDPQDLKNFIFMCMHGLLFSPVWFCTTFWIVAHQAPLSRGFYRQDYWVGCHFSPLGDLPNSGIEPASPAKGFFTCWNIGEHSHSFLQWKNAEQISKGKRLPSKVQRKPGARF